MNELSDLQERLDLSEERNRINNIVAVSVALLSVFMAITKVKDDNIVQTMLQAKSDAVDSWNEYQSTKIKHHLAELGVNQAKSQKLMLQGRGEGEVAKQQERYEAAIIHYQTEEKDLAMKARALEKQYDALNYRDDQFDLSDATVSISLALLAVTSLTGKRKLLLLAWVFAGFGIIMGVAGLVGLSLHPDLLVKMLS
ncbi:MAG: DUF4337 domain-containing protein [Chlorobiaceae bacterium]